MRGRLRGWAVALLAVVLAGCGADEPIRVGFIGGLSGRVSDIGLAGRDGVRLAIEHANARGGIDGRPIDLIVRDDGHSAVQAQRAFDELIAAGVQVVIGPMTSAMATALMPSAERAGMMMVSPTVSSSRFSGIDDHFVRVSSTSREYAAASARYVAIERGLRRAALILDTDNEAFTADWARLFTAAFETAGGAVVSAERFDASVAASLQPHVARMLDARPDLLVIVAAAVDVARIAQLVRRTDTSVVLLGSAWAGTEQLLAVGGRAVEGMFVPQLFDREDASPRYAAFRAEYRARFSDAPGFVAVAAYDAATLAIDGLARGERGAGLKSHLVSRGLDGLQQRIEIDAYGDSRRDIQMMTVAAGRFRRVGEAALAGQ